MPLGDGFSRFGFRTTDVGLLACLAFVSIAIAFGIGLAFILWRY